MDFSKWQNLMVELGFKENKQTFDLLLKAYSEKHRHYHTFEHINACLNHLNQVSHMAENPREIELALWFHDAVYKPFSGSNEKDSANWAKQFLQDNHADRQAVERVYDLIMVTLHDCSTQTSDQALLVDIDLSILGSTASVYKVFEENIRKEYKRVPYFIYRRKRKAILKGFLQKEHIYNTLYFRNLFETQAKINITQALLKL